MSCRTATLSFSASMSQNKAARLVWLDALRGFCVVLMLLYHTAYDLASVELIPESLLYRPSVTGLHWGFTSLFVLISGFSCTLSRSNTRRGLRLLGLALLLSGATALAERLALRLFDAELFCFIAFGILHMLSLSMLLYGLLLEKCRGMDSPYAGVFFCAASLLTAGLATGAACGASWLFPFGFISEGFRSADYFPLLPWGFVFLFGAWLGRQYAAGRLPLKVPDLGLCVLPWLGRHALLLYFVHQPVILAACFGTAALLRIL